MWYDRDIDALMARTQDRPVPSGRVAPGEALGFGIVLSVGSVLLMGLTINLVAAAFMYMLYSNCLNIVQSYIAQGRLSFLAGLFIIHGIAAVAVLILFSQRLAVPGLFGRRRPRVA